MRPLAMFILPIILAAAAAAEVPTVRCPAEPPSIRTCDLVDPAEVDPQSIRSSRSAGGLTSRADDC